MEVTQEKKQATPTTTGSYRTPEARQKIMKNKVEDRKEEDITDNRE